MKLVLLAGAALVATPTLAQMAPTTPPAQTAPDAQTAPSGTVPDTALSTSPTPSDGPRAQQGNMPQNNAAGAAQMQTDPNAAPMAAPMADPNAAAPAAPMADTSAPAAPMEHPPMCKAGQFTGCMEPGNGGHHTTRHTTRRHK